MPKYYKYNNYTVYNFKILAKSPPIIYSYTKQRYYSCTNEKYAFTTKLLLSISNIFLSAFNYSKNASKFYIFK